MSAAQTVEERIVELLALRDKVDAELHRLDAIRKPGQRRSRFEEPRCGTESGYQRHRYLRETCDDCKRAHAAHERLRAIRRRSEQAVA